MRLAAAVFSDGMRLACSNSAAAAGAVGAGVGLLPQALVFLLVGWGPTGNDNVGEWYVTLAFLGACPALVSAMIAAVLLRTRLRAVGTGMLGALGALSLLWMIGMVAYGLGAVPPGMVDAPRMR
ncbi:hypothetical protein [Micromonospora echinaurantiaca]|uniref:hypothetical protein n=1 Tax=Micromonospora echinaurantiaca TaxID=47857 RepID=UPI0037A2BCDB